MKRVDDIYDSICDMNNIIKMCDKVLPKVRNKQKREKFTLYKIEHLVNIKNKLESKNIAFKRYNIFLITDPKCRIVMAEEIEDKIINHLIAEYFLVAIYENIYIDSMCATRKGRGTSYGIKLLYKYLNKLKSNYDNFYVLKIDIKKYFYNVDHNVLKSMLRKKIKDKDVLKVLDEIINTTNEPYINDIITKLRKRRINGAADIPLYKYGKGLALGNQTSQAFGLIYLNEFNHFLKEELHLKYTINYMDDFLILHNDKEYLRYCLKRIDDYLNNVLKLELNKKKTKIDSIKNGIEFLGYRFIIVDKKIIKKVKKATIKRRKKKLKDLEFLAINK